MAKHCYVSSVESDFLSNMLELKATFKRLLTSGPGPLGSFGFVATERHVFVPVSNIMIRLFGSTLVLFAVLVGPSLAGYSGLSAQTTETPEVPETVSYTHLTLPTILLV